MDTKKPGYRSSRAVAFGADNGARTRDPNLGKVVLYQLSHVRLRGLILRDARIDVYKRQFIDDAGRAESVRLGKRMHRVGFFGEPWSYE